MGSRARHRERALSDALHHRHTAQGRILRAFLGDPAAPMFRSPRLEPKG